MGEWKEIELGEIVDFYSGGTPSKKKDDFWNGSIPWISAKTLTWHKVSKSNLNISELGLENGSRLAKKNDILLLVRGSGLFNKIPICWVEEPVAFNQDIKALRAKKPSEQEYIYYWPHGNKSELNNILEETGIGAGKFDTDLLKKLIVQIPNDDDEKKIIVNLAKSIFEKIDLLHRQNETLEGMAEVLFREWFVEKTKKEWEFQPLGNLIEVKRGGSPRPIQDYLSDSGLRWLKISDATKTSAPFIFHIKEHIKVEGLKKTTLLKAGKIVLSNSATPGIPKILAVDSCIHDGWLHFPKSHFSNEYLYLLFKKIRPALLLQGNGSIFTNLKTDILKEFEIAVPDEPTLTKFDKLVIPLFKKMYSNSEQINNLENLRDTLLPKLMSGEVGVKLSESGFAG